MMISAAVALWACVLLVAAAAHRCCPPPSAPRQPPTPTADSLVSLDPATQCVLVVPALALQLCLRIARQPATWACEAAEHV
jgi:hypothetical protein